MAKYSTLSLSDVDEVSSDMYCSRYSVMDFGNPVSGHTEGSHVMCEGFQASESSRTNACADPGLLDASVLPLCTDVSD